MSRSEISDAQIRPRETIQPFDGGQSMVGGEAASGFQPGQGAAAAADRATATERQVAVGNIPSVNIDFSPNQGGLDNGESRRLAAASAAERGIKGTDRSVPHRPVDASRPAGASDHGDEQVKINPNASQGFRDQVGRMTDSIRVEMPPAVREATKDVDIKPVRSITDRQSGQLVSGAYDNNEMIVAERRPRGSGSPESVIKHEFGHAFDQNANGPGGRMLSEDPEFRKLVNEEARIDPRLARAIKGEGDHGYSEIFADQFASVMRTPGRELSFQSIDRLMPRTREWVRQRMHR